MDNGGQSDWLVEELDLANADGQGSDGPGRGPTLRMATQTGSGREVGDKGGGGRLEAWESKGRSDTVGLADRCPGRTALWVALATEPT